MSVPKSSSHLLRFSTENITPESRIQLWEGHNARALIPLDIRTLDDQPMRSRQINLQLPSIRMADVTGSSQIVERSESFINDHPTGVVAFFFALEGEAFFFHRGGHLTVQPGQAVLYDADLPFTRGFSRGLREVVLTIPREQYREIAGPQAPVLPVVFNFGARGGAPEQALARLIRRTITLVSGPQPTLDPAHTEEEVLALLRLTLGQRDDGQGILAAAKAYIERHLVDQDLSPGRVAAAVGLSDRQLSRHFADEGVSIGRYVQGQRVDLAREVLRDPERRGLSIAEVAVLCGFASQSHFGRVFRERVGMTPLQWRKR